MKSYLVAMLVAIAATVMGVNDSNAAPKRLKGSGEIIRKQIELPAFHAVQSSRAVDVILVADTGQQSTIEADDNVMEYVVAEVKNGVLRCTISDKIRTISSIHVKITVPTDGKLSSLSASSASEIKGEVMITGAEVDLSASSAAKINAKIEADEVDADLSSAATIKAEVSGGSCSIDASSSANFKGTLAVRHCEVDASSAADVYLEGAALSCDVELSSAADLNATKFAVKGYKIEVSSAADADILCLDTLNASATSAGDITYTGNCTQTRISRSSGGSIKRR